MSYVALHFTAKLVSTIFKGMLIQNSVNRIGNLYSIVITQLTRDTAFHLNGQTERYMVTLCMKVCLRYLLQWKKILANSFKEPEFFGFIFSQQLRSFCQVWEIRQGVQWK